MENREGVTPAVTHGDRFLRSRGGEKFIHFNVKLCDKDTKTKSNS